MIFALPLGPVFEQALEKIEREPAYRELLAIRCATAEEIVAAARKADSCVLFLRAGSEADVRRHMALQKALLPRIKSGQLQVVLAYPKEIETQARYLAGALNAEEVREPFSLKGILFKIERMASSETSMSKSTMAASTTASIASTAFSRPPAELGIDPKLPVRFVPSLSLKFDFWKQVRSGIRQQGGRWTIHMKGPPPLLGGWERCAVSLERQIKHPAATDNKLWIWKPRPVPSGNAIESLLPGEADGVWIFAGAEPKFQGEHWYFSSPKPLLGFFSNARSLGFKLEHGTNGQLNVAADSPQASATLAAMDASLANRKSAQVGRANSDNSSAPGAASGSKPGDASRLEESKRNTFAMVDPLRFASDCFVLLKEKPRRVSRKWVLALIGPPPDFGKWVMETVPEEPVSMRVAPRSDDTLWRWLPTDKMEDPFVRDKGAWMFRGLQPRFVSNQWIFTGTEPELSFRRGGQAIASKLLCRPDGSLAIARDSRTALALLPMIEDHLFKAVKPKSITKKNEAAAESDAAKVEAEQPDASGELSPEAIDAGSGSDNGADTGADSSGESGSDAVFKIPRKNISNKAGKWESVSARSRKRRWFVFLPADYDAEDPQAYRFLPFYWSYLGFKSPSLISEGGVQYWVFTGRKPVRTESFHDLPKPVQEYFLYASRRAGDGELGRVEAQKSEDAAKDPRVTFRADEQEAKSDEDPGLIAPSEDLKPAESPSIDYSIEREEKKGLAFDDVFEREELATDWKNHGSKDTSVQDDSPEPEVEASSGENPSIAPDFVETVEPQAEGAQDYVETPSEQGQSLDYSESRDGHVDGPQLYAEDQPSAAAQDYRDTEIQRGQPSKPSLSPLSFAFLMSELQAKRDERDPSHGLATERISHRFCNYVSKALGRVRVELWVLGEDGQWSCAGTFDESAPKLSGYFDTLREAPSQGSLEVDGTGTAYLVPVTEKPGAPAGAKVVGVLAIAGGGVEQIDPRWAFAVGNMARGVLVTLSRRMSGEWLALGEDEKIAS